MNDIEIKEYFLKNKDKIIKITKKVMIIFCHAILIVATCGIWIMPLLLMKMYDLRNREQLKFIEIQYITIKEQQELINSLSKQLKNIKRRQNAKRN